MFEGRKGGEGRRREGKERRRKREQEKKGEGEEEKGADFLRKVNTPRSIRVLWVALGGSVASAMLLPSCVFPVAVSQGCT